MNISMRGKQNERNLFKKQQQKRRTKTMYEVKVNGWVRISKAVARKWYNDGRVLCLCMNNTCPDNIQHLGYTVCCKSNFDQQPTFDQLVNQFTYYYSGQGLGRYPAFYIKENDIAESNDIVPASKIKTILGMFK